VESIMLKSILPPLAILSLVVGATGSGCRYYAGRPGDCFDDTCATPCDDNATDDGMQGEGEGGGLRYRDGDGLSDEFEAGRGTDPDNADTDGDGDSDGDEIACGTSPLDPFLRCPDDAPDADDDGLSDDFEAGRGTDPDNADTDGDGDSDGDEVTCGSSPLDPHFTCDNPPTPGENGGCG
jgi:hypothetical protein